MAASAGRVLLIGKGTYDSSVTYSPLDWVRYEGKSYVCKAESTGNAPTDTSYWNLLAQDGQDGEEGQVSLQMLSDTVGWTGKNLIPNHGDAVSKGITWTVNADGSITATGTTGNNYSIYEMNVPSDLVGNFYFSGCPANGSNSTYDIYAYDSTISARCKKWNGTTNSSSDYGQGNVEVQFVNSHTSKIILRIYANQSNVNKTFYPMVRRASVSDDTYEPYHEDVEFCKYNRSEANKLGAKNLYKPVPAGTKTVENIDWIINADGTVEADGTCSATTASKLQITERYGKSGEKQFFPNGKYIINGNPDDSTTFLQVGVTKSGSYASLAQGVGDVAFEVDGDDSSNDGAYVQIVCGVVKNTTVSHVLFKPMIRLASDPDNTYVPYAMTNKELTDDVKLNNLYLTSSDSSINTIKKVITEIFTQVIPLLIQDWTKCSGLINVPGMPATCFTVFRTSSTAFRCMLFLDQYIYVGKSISGTVTVWKFTGTEES